MQLGQSIPLLEDVIKGLLTVEPSEGEIRNKLVSCRSKLQSDPRFGTQLLSMLGKQRKALLASLVLSALHEAECEVNVIHVSACMAACQTRGQWQLAVHLLSSMLPKAIETDTGAYNTCIAACDKHRQWQFAMTLFRAMPRRRLHANAITCGSCICACQSGSRWQLALDLETILPDAGAIACSACASACQTASQWQHAMHFVVDMSAQRTPVDTIAYNTWISACEQGRQWQLALHLLTKMPAAVVDTDTITYNSCMSACQKGKAWQVALALLDNMPLKQVQANMISYSACISACEKDGKWQLALHLLDSMEKRNAFPDTITCSSCISVCEKCRQWQLAGELIAGMNSASIRADAICFNSCMSACEKGSQWNFSLGMIEVMLARRLRSNTISYNTCISACETGEKWQAALLLAACIATKHLVLDIVGHSACISACEKGGQWRFAMDRFAALLSMKAFEANTISYNACMSACENFDRWPFAFDLLCHMHGKRADANRITRNACVSACTKSKQWELASLLLFGEMHVIDIEPDVTAYCSAIRAFDHASNEKGLQLLRKMEEQSIEQGSPSYLWCLASLGDRDLQRTERAVVAAPSCLMLAEHTPEELAILAWACGYLGTFNLKFLDAILERASAQITEFKLQDFLLLSWGMCTCLHDVPSNVQVEIDRHLQRWFTITNDQQPCGENIKATLGLVWVYRLGGLLTNSFRAMVLRALMQKGVTLDHATHQICDVKSAELLHRSDQQVSRTYLHHRNVVEPTVVFDLPDRLVFLKPPDWEVFDQNVGHQLLAYSQAFCRNWWPILRDSSCAHGFLHRLDVPSSGLIIAAKTFQAYYDLRIQLSAGEVVRDYLVLCHGWFQCDLHEINIALHCMANLPTNAGWGRPCSTHCKIIAHYSDSSRSFSLLIIRIASGRKHQIRSHCSYIGHPTVCDGMYTSGDTFHSDRSWCPQNMLHRYRLVFGSGGFERREVVESASADLSAALGRLRAKDQSSGRIGFVY
eukprot:TRINITY_DN18677_c0_g2_i1.p1 TRINITY_DN18677_c0_g2~~TRINITY_DN18677_c0_g2_i1.p1  ORF type:complete len:993 (+),score=119.58 TRINITY_DN18677_c0_g2_i1:112-3090(+)